MSKEKLKYGNILHRLFLFPLLSVLLCGGNGLFGQTPRILVPKEKPKIPADSKSQPINIDDELRKNQPTDRAVAYYHYCIARLYEASDDIERSISEFREAIKYDWDNSTLRSELATTLFRAGSFVEAVSECRKAIALDNDNADAHYLLGLFTMRLASSSSKKQLEEAIREFEEVIRIDADDPRPYLSLGQIYLVNKDFETAIKYLEKFRTLAGDSAEGYYLLATAYEGAGKKAKAIENLKKLLAVNPGSERGMNMLMDLYARSNDVDNLIDLLRKSTASGQPSPLRGRQLVGALLAARRYDEAIAELKAQIEADENNALAYVYLGRAYTGLRQPEKAAEAFAKAKTMGEDDKEVLYNLALAYEENGQSERAVTQLQALFESTTKMSAIYSPQEREERLTYLRQIGSIYLRMGEPGQAVAALSRLAELSENPRDLELLASAHRNNKEIEKALAANDAALKRFPDDKFLKYQKALLLAHQGNANQAAELISPLIERDPNDLENYLALSEVHVQAKQFTKAEDILFKAKELDASNDHLRFRLGAVYERAKEYDKAEAIFLELIEKNPKSAETLNYLGYMLADRGVKLDSALSYVKRAVELDPNNAAYLDSLGWAYFKLNDLRLAEENLERAVRRLKNDPTIHEHLGDLYYKTGNLSKAEEAWQKAIAFGNETEEIEKVKTKIQTLIKR